MQNVELLLSFLLYYSLAYLPGEAKIEVPYKYINVLDNWKQKGDAEANTIGWEIIQKY